MKKDRIELKDFTRYSAGTICFMASASLLGTEIRKGRASTGLIVILSICMAASLFVVIRTIYLAIKVEKRKK